MNKAISQAVLLTCMFFATSSHASVARLTLAGTQGDWITGGQDVDVVLSSADPLLLQSFTDFNNIGTSAAPAADSLFFLFQRDSSPGLDDPFTVLRFSTQGLGAPINTGFIYENAIRWFGIAGHPGLDVVHDSRGCFNVSGSFTVDRLSFANEQISQFSASFSQSCDGGALMHGSFFYDANLTSLPPVPEPSTLSLLGIGVLGLCAMRRRNGLRV
jgi:hypothetical protein